MALSPLSTLPARPMDLGRRRKPRTPRGGRVTTILLVLCSASVIVPLYVTIAMSFKTAVQASDPAAAFALPWPLSIDGFVEAWVLTNFPAGLMVSTLVTVVVVTATILIASAASFAIARNWQRRTFRWSFYYVLAAMFIPFPVVALPQIQLTGLLGLDNPFGVMILATMFQMSFSVLLFTAFLRSIPAELEESARIDGASTWRIYRSIVFPLLAPMSATVGIFAFLASWNDFMMPSLIISDPALQTLPVLQSAFQSQFSSNYSVSFASYLMAMAPAVIVYLFMQRWVMEGVTQGAVKG